MRDVLLHNMREEMEHAAMLLEWIRRRNADFAGHLRTYLFTDGPLESIESEAEGAERGGAPSRDAAASSIGSLVGR